MKASEVASRLQLSFRTEREYDELRSALIREQDHREHGAFIFASQSDDLRLDVVEVAVLSGDDFSKQSMGFLELREGALQDVIMRAHRSNTALVEAHSHPFTEGPDVRFSQFDCRGLKATGPQISWRLPGRPYMALVFGRNAFDSLFWAKRKRRPKGVVDIRAGSTLLNASGQSYLAWEE